MSLALLQDYSSADEEDVEPTAFHDLRDSDSDDFEDGDHPHRRSCRPPNSSSLVDDLKPPSSSDLPSAFDAFSQVAGPPDFLNNSVQEQPSVNDIQRGKRRQRDKKDLPAGAVLESKPNLVGIHERVRSDIEGAQPASSIPTASKEGKRVATATNPGAEDAADLLRMCLQCGVPKTYTSAKGMVCPICNDRPVTEANNEPKKKGSMIKDKEKSKRMRGQSSHATWKSETEMQLRQQFD
ncbi:hypothetical protein MLD38_023211 [Melastoma candidum]|uniref:Uncharacterized protein n=1 Tax=Melastoma candidum TaxID=119954 RepID=A0ACB9QPV2_9MYRT|nr:hypothetical protein MLD38_023211 [Melastoma candidum]